MNPILAEAINEQIRAEFHSAYIYLAMAAWANENNLPGTAHWLRMQWQEETLHATKFLDFLHSRNASVHLLAIDEPPRSYASLIDVFEHVLHHEQSITERINVLYDKAVEHRDRPLQILLQWFINEQVEEESQVQGILDQLKLVGSDGPSIFLLDRQFASRPAPATNPE